MPKATWQGKDWKPHLWPLVLCQRESEGKGIQIYSELLWAQHCVVVSSALSFNFTLSQRFCHSLYRGRSWDLGEVNSFVLINCRPLSDRFQAKSFGVSHSCSLHTLQYGRQALPWLVQMVDQTCIAFLWLLWVQKVAHRGCILLLLLGLRILNIFEYSDTPEQWRNVLPSIPLCTSWKSYTHLKHTCLPKDSLWCSG